MIYPIIFLTFANDADAHLPLLKEESRLLQRALAEIEQKELVKVHREESAEIKDIFNFFVEHQNQIAIFHYGGHANSTQLQLEGGAGNAKGLATLFGEQKNLKLVFLNGCYSKGQVQTLLDSGVKAVIATSVPVGDKKAKEFAQQFYQALAQLHTIEQAFKTAESFLKTLYREAVETHFRSFSIEDLSNMSDSVEISGLPWNLYIKDEHRKEILNYKLSYLMRDLGYQRYAEKIGREYLKPIFEGEEMTLADIYIEPDFTIHKHCFEENDLRLKDQGNYFQSKETQSRFLFPLMPTEENKTHNPYKDNLHKITSSFLCGNHGLGLASDNAKVMLLLGHPGQGKTSFCKRLVYDIIHGNQNIEKEVFLIKLRGILKAKELITDPLEVLAKELKPYFGENEISVSRISQGLLILDGLDELFMKEGLTHSDIDDLCRNLANFTDGKYPNLQVILTSRTAYVDIEKLRKKQFLVLHLGLLNLDQQIEFIDRYKKFNTCKLDKDKLIEIHEDDHFKNIRELTNQPIILQLIAKADYEIATDSSITKIYNNLFQSLIKNVLNRDYSKSGKLDIFENFKERDLERYMEEIALSIYQSDFEYIRRSDLEKLPATDKFMKKLKSADLGDALKSLAISFYFQEVDPQKEDIREEKDNYALEFLHKSLQEFLVAKKIWHTFIEIGEEKSNGELLYEDGEWLKVLSLVFPVLSPKSLSKEVFDYLVELIQEDEITDKEKLTERLKQFFPKLVKKDFLFKYDSESSSENPILLAQNTFFGYWSVMACVNTSGNLLTSELKEKIGFYLRIPPPPAPFLLSNQDLSFLNLQGANLNGANLNGANLNGANLEGAILKEAYLEGANLNVANLYRAILYGANLKEAYLVGANLNGANLYRAILYGANLYIANLEEAYLKIANLNVANLYRANLEGANLQGAHLEGANLEGANLNRAILYGANLEGANFEGANLNKTQNLTAEQLSKVYTLYQTKNIPSEIEEELRKTHSYLFDIPKET
ncbi:MAG: pentapeptide repeat-containing protein [Bacteroidia bacterium]